MRNLWHLPYLPLAVLVVACGVPLVGSQQQVKGKIVKGSASDKANVNKKNTTTTKQAKISTGGGRKVLPKQSNVTSKVPPQSKTMDSPSQETLEQQQQRLVQEAKLLEQQQQQQKEEDQIAAATAAAANEQIRLQRERAFELELARMTQEQQKAAQRQKKKDAKVVRRVLRAFSQQRLYHVLGIRHHEITIPAMKLQLFQTWNVWSGGPYQFFHISSKHINRAYRNRALQVHPDKNRDGRAEEAFVAVNQAASILLDAKLRHVYDQELRHIQSARRRQQMQIIQSVMNQVIGVVTKTTATMRKLLGPFFLPFVILGALLI